MSRFVNGAVERLDLGDGDWAEVRSRLKYGDRAAIESKLLHLRFEGGRIAGGDLDMREGNLELLMRAITAWGGPGFCEQHDHPHAGICQARPITRDNIEALDVSADRILAFIEKNAVRGTPDFTRPLSPGTSTDGAEQPTPPSVPASSPSAAATDGATTS